MSDEKKTVLSMRHINKTFPGVKALSDAQLTLREGEIHALMGENGAGKSTLINHLVPEAEMETGKISEKADRGKHTTRHSELFRLEKDSYILDTPGFTALEPEAMEKEELIYLAIN